MGTWRTPPGPEGVLCEPPLSQWTALAEANRAAAAKWDFDILGVPAVQLRTGARRAVPALDTTEGGDFADLLFVTGHQPQFYHPGVWMKSFAVTEAARRAGGLGINWVVDHDAGGLAADIPRRGPHAGGASGGAAGNDLHVTTRRLVAAAPGRPLEALPGPTRAQTAAFVETINDDLATLGLARQRDLWWTFADGLTDLVGDGLRNAAEVGWRSRAAYERALGHELVPDVPLSRVCATREFLLFFVHWVAHAAELRAAYNRALAQVRAARGVRSKANPFPDLLLRPDGSVELPFWGLTAAGIRRKLYVRREPGQYVLSHLEGDFAVPADGDGAVDALIESRVQVRPRAVPLTVFSRLFIADVFVHGTGGARYDEVTDLFIADVFGIEPPRFAVVSATVQLPLGERPVQPSARWALQHKLRDLRFNPQRYAWEAAGVNDALDERLGALLREKEQLIDEIGRARRGGPGSREYPDAGHSIKRVLTRSIERTNAELYALLSEIAQETQERLGAWQRKAHSGAVAVRRTYPFFFYDPKQMAALLRNGGR